MGVKVVPFHPHFAMARAPPKMGDTIFVPGPDGADLRGGLRGWGRCVGLRV